MSKIKSYSHLSDEGIAFIDEMIADGSEPKAINEAIATMEIGGDY